MPRSHDRKSFFKYVTAETAKKILENSSFRWSSPEVFNRLNDPFDVPREFAEGISPEDFQQAFHDRYTRLLSEPSTWNEPYNSKVKFILAMARSVPPSNHPWFLEEMRKTWRESPTEMRAMDEMRQLWRTLRPRLRILCLTQNPSTQSLWLKYSENYSGAVIEVGCMDIYDSPWNLAERVNYSENVAQHFSAEKWVEWLLYKEEMGINKMFSAHTTNKDKSWSHEEEYRVITFARKEETGLTSDWTFNPRHIQRVLFGHHFDPERLSKLRSFLASKYPWTQVQQTRIGASKLLFDSI